MVRGQTTHFYSVETRNPRETPRQFPNHFAASACEPTLSRTYHGRRVTEHPTPLGRRKPKGWTGCVPLAELGSVGFSPLPGTCPSAGAFASLCPAPCQDPEPLIWSSVPGHPQGTATSLPSPHCTGGRPEQVARQSSLTGVSVHGTHRGCEWSSHVC